MRKILAGLSVLCVLVSGCETHLSFPPGYTAKPKEVKPVSVKAVEGRTPLELLRAAEKNVETVYYTDWGYYVTGIGKTKNETDLGPAGRYWVLYVNGQKVKEGTDKVRLKGDEKVEFRYETPS